MEKAAMKYSFFIVNIYMYLLTYEIEILDKSIKSERSRISYENIQHFTSYKY